MDKGKTVNMLAWDPGSPKMDFEDVCLFVDSHLGPADD